MIKNVSARVYFLLASRVRRLFEVDLVSPRSWTQSALPTRFLLALAALIFSNIPVTARTWIVDATSDTPTIQAGIDSAASADTVLVHPGTYYEQIIFRGRDIVVKGDGGAASTIIDASRSGGSVAVFRSGESIACVLEGFTLTGGQGTLQQANTTYGGAVACLGSGATIQDNVITGNQAKWGGGIHIAPDLSSLDSTPPTLHLFRNILDNNHSFGNGGALFAQDSYLLIDGNVFRDNKSDFDGGAISSYLVRGEAVIANNQMINNFAGDKGGAIELGGSTLYGGIQFRVESNLIARNAAMGSDAGDSGAGGGIYASGEGTLGEFAHNTIAFNVGLGESDCGGGGIALGFSTTNALLIENNIVAFNVHCGVACRTIGPSQGVATFRYNLFWGNGGGDFGEETASCPLTSSSENYFADPQFCNAAIDDYHVAASSPALTAASSPIGVYPIAGCPPVATERITWGHLKSFYSTGVN